MDEPLFAFGYGLSYTDFLFGDATINTDSIGYGESALLTIPVTNIGKYNGEETVQIYVHKKGDTEGPLKTLRNYKK